MTPAERYNLAVYEEQRARCVALSPRGHWRVSGGFRLRPLTARDVAILDEAAPAWVRGGAVQPQDYAVLLWHCAYPHPPRWTPRIWWGWRVGVALETTDLRADVDDWLAMQTQDLYTGAGGRSGGKEYVAASVALAVSAAGQANPVPLLDVPLITLGQIIKMRDAARGEAMSNASDRFLPAALGIIGGNEHVD